VKALLFLCLLTFPALGLGASAYHCPMKCEGEKTYAAPGKCPKCGMPLVQDKPVRKVKMDFALSPEKPEPGKSAKLTLTPVLRADGSVVKELDVVHEKKIHFFLVSQDLSWFRHLHPDGDEKGSYSLEVVFPEAGNFLALADFTPKGEPGEVSFHPFQVAGKAPPAKPLVLSREWKEEDFDFKLEIPKGTKAGKAVGLVFKTKKGGKPIEGLENYLGALGHCVAFHEDLSEYLHAHPPHGEAPKQTSEIEFHAAFPKPGRYKIWMQFQHGGKVRTSEFVVKIP